MALYIRTDWPINYLIVISNKYKSILYKISNNKCNTNNSINSLHQKANFNGNPSSKWATWTSWTSLLASTSTTNVIMVTSMFITTKTTAGPHKTKWTSTIHSKRTRGRIRNPTLLKARVIFRLKIKTWANINHVHHSKSREPWATKTTSLQGTPQSSVAAHKMCNNHQTKILVKIKYLFKKTNRFSSTPTKSKDSTPRAASTSTYLPLPPKHRLTITVTATQTLRSLMMTTPRPSSPWPWVLSLLRVQSSIIR